MPTARPVGSMKRTSQPAQLLTLLLVNGGSLSNMLFRWNIAVHLSLKLYAAVRFHSE